MVDYSKWKNIEISDDEDDTHPNIDTPSLYRWRHNARVERMEQAAQEKTEHEKRKTENAKKLSDTRFKVKEAEECGASNLTDLKLALDELEKEETAIKEKEDDIRKKDKVTPWNVDTISKPGFAKTVINKESSRSKDEQLTDEERESRLQKFIKQNEKDLKHYGMLRKYDDSRDFLRQNINLVCEDTANYLVIWCINLEMEGKTELMTHVAHQCICMQFILEVAKKIDRDPRSCLEFFFRIQVAEPEHKASFDAELTMFKQRITRRAAEKLDEAQREAEEEERQKRLGPGGLDPVEVFDSLPDELKKCFESQNIELLQETIATMPEEDAKYHMKRCVDSGLWLPDSKKNKEKDSEEEKASTS